MRAAGVSGPKNTALNPCIGPCGNLHRVAGVQVVSGQPAGLVEARHLGLQLLDDVVGHSTRGRPWA